MRGPDFDGPESTALPDVQLGAVEFYAVRTCSYFGGELVRFFISHNDRIENDGRAVVMSRKAFDAMTATANRQAA